MVIDALKSPSLSVGEAATQNSEMVSQQGKGLSLSITEEVGGRFAMVSILLSAFTELLNGHPVLDMIR